MKTVYNGWVNEINENKSGYWIPKKKEDYIKHYSEKEIVCSADNVESDILSKKLKEHKEKK